MQLAFGLINSLIFIVAFLIQKPKIKKNHSYIYILIVMFMHLLLFGFNALQEAISLITIILMLIYLEKIPFNLSILITFRCTTYQFLANILLDFFETFLNLEVGISRLIYDSILVIISIIFLHHLFTFIQKIGYMISKKFFFVQFIANILIYFMKLYIQISSYVFSYIIINKHQQHFFQMTYCSLVLIFIISCIALNYSFQNIKRAEKVKAQEEMSMAINRYLNQRVLSSKLFVHDQINLLNQFKNQVTTKSPQEVLGKIDSLKKSLKSQDQAFLSLSLIEPVALQYFLYNHLIYLQQMGVECIIELYNKVTYHNALLPLITLFDQLFEEVISIIKKTKEKKLIFSLFEDREELLIILTVSDDQGATSHKFNLWKHKLGELKTSSFNICYDPTNKKMKWELVLVNRKEV